MTEPTTEAGRQWLAYRERTVERLAAALHATAWKNHPPAPMLRSICQGADEHIEQAAAILAALTRDHARCEALREALVDMLANLERWAHGEDCGVWSCERCDAAEDRDHWDPYDDPTHAGCDCGLSEVVTKARAALAEPAP